MKSKGFTLIELLVVVAIIGVLATVVLSNLGEARGRADDAKKRTYIKQLATASEIYYLDNDQYPNTVGWLIASGSFLSTTMAPYIAPPDSLPSDTYMYWRKDYRNAGYPCMTEGNAEQMGYYVRLDNPTPADLATMTGSFDACVQSTWGMNFKAGN